jgi:hypothetical protein
MAKLIITSNLINMALKSNPLQSHREGYFVNLLERAFRDAGWRVEVEPHLIGDLFVSKGPNSYIVELKVAHEGRKDRVIPLLSMGILQAQAVAKDYPRSKAMAVVAAPRIPESLASEIFNFASKHAPDVAVGMLDLEGFRAFNDPDLQIFNAERSSIYEEPSIRAEPADLFSDLNQWLLKVLLAKYIPEHLLNAPRANYRNASELASAADVSVMSAFRFLRQLEAEGFLDASRSVLKLVRLEQLLWRWQSANLKPPREFPLRWILKGQSADRLGSMLRSYRDNELRPSESSQIHPGEDIHSEVRICLALFSAANALGFGLVQGVPEYIYVERMNLNFAKQLGLSLRSEGKVDVFARKPPVRRSVFRGAVIKDGVPVSDILQVWLDVAAHPARGSEQANEIKARILNPILKEAGL